MRHRGGMSLRCRSDVAFLHRSDIALRRRSDIAKRNHLGREGGRSDVAATFVKVAAMSLRPPCDLKFLLGRSSLRVSYFSAVYVGSAGCLCRDFVTKCNVTLAILDQSS